MRGICISLTNDGAPGRLARAPLSPWARARAPSLLRALVGNRPARARACRPERTLMAAPAAARERAPPPRPKISAAAGRWQPVAAAPRSGRARPQGRVRAAKAVVGSFLFRWTNERASCPWARGNGPHHREGKPMRRANLALAVLLATAGAVPAQSDQQEALEILHARAPEMLDSKTVNVPVYMTIRNGLRKDERLLGASTPYAEKVELIED